MVKPQPLASLASAIGLRAHEHIALVGGGGKTTLLHALGSQLDGSIVLTTTTKMSRDQHGDRDVLLSPSISEIRTQSQRAPVIAWRRLEGDKALGVTPGACDEWFEHVDHVVVEADGSRQLPFKAPAVHEPVVGASTTVMISVLGADALGRVIADQCHRPLRVAALAECSPYERLSPSGAASVLTHERGARRALPSGARLVVAITKVNESNIYFVEELLADLAKRAPQMPAIPIQFEDS